MLVVFDDGEQMEGVIREKAKFPMIRGPDGAVSRDFLLSGESVKVLLLTATRCNVPLSLDISFEPTTLPAKKR